MAETNIKDVKLKIGTETQFQSKLKDLPINTLVGTTDPIQEGELDTSIITKLNKAENALPKPTNDTTGSAGQVLKKTANGSEWGDAPSGGGKLYRHYVMISQAFQIYLTLYRPTLNQIESIDDIAELNNGALIVGIYTDGDVLVTVQKAGTSLKVNGLVYEFSEIRQINADIPISQISIVDTVTEL